jgi:hypothetical protein
MGIAVEFRPLEQLAMEGAATDTHQLGSLGAITTGLGKGLA